MSVMAAAVRTPSRHSHRLSRGAAAGADQRAGLLATLYLVGYSGAAVPGMIAGRLAGALDLFEIAVGYAVLGAVAALVATVAATNPVEKENTP
jgi:hypothetical protein